MFNFKEPAVTGFSCSAEDAVIAGEGDIRINASHPEQWRLVLPEEIEILSAATIPGQKIFHVKSRIAGFRNAYPVFAVAEGVTDGKHSAAMCSGMLYVNTESNSISGKGRISSGLLLVLVLIFLIVFICLLNKTGTRLNDALLKYSGRMFFIAISYYVLKNLDAWLNSSLQYFDWRPYRYLINVFAHNLNGGNYQNFFYYFIDAYFIICLLFVFPYYYWRDRKWPVAGDKYVSFLKTLWSVISIFRKEGIYWNRQSKLGMLTIFVKFFFVPLMVSWSINNIFHIRNLIISPPQWNLYTLNAFLTDLFILIDTAIFAFGYLIESRFLRNEIKSVEPTFLGWLVCLWCYPPFNVFSFKPFDYPLVDISISSPQWVHAVMTCVITSLWGIFAWASAALCFKGSNLTNRGIVKSGPYCFVRHPAYTAKVLIWIIQGVFFAQFTAGILIAFAVIYFLRAWTEERHLSLDADYLEYKKAVKWRFVPGLI